MNHLKLGINYNGTPYHLIWLNPVPEKKELFIQFISNKKDKAKSPTFKDGKILHMEGAWDHLSFHKDGKLHIRTKLKGKKKEYIYNKMLPHSIYDFGDIQIIPILSNTYSIHGNEEQFKQIHKNEIDKKISNNCLESKTKIDKPSILILGEFWSEEIILILEKMFLSILLAPIFGRAPFLKNLRANQNNFDPPQVHLLATPAWGEGRKPSPHVFCI